MLASKITCISPSTLACAAVVTQVTRLDPAVRASLIVVQPWHKNPIDLLLAEVLLHTGAGSRYVSHLHI